MKFALIAGLFAAVVVADNHEGILPPPAAPAPAPAAPAPAPAAPAPAPGKADPAMPHVETPAGDDTYGSSSYMTSYTSDYSTSTYASEFTSECSYEVKTISTDYTTVLPTVIYETMSDCYAPEETYPAASSYASEPTPTYYQAGAGANAASAAVVAVAGLAAIVLA